MFLYIENVASRILIFVMCQLYEKKLSPFLFITFNNIFSFHSSFSKTSVHRNVSGLDEEANRQRIPTGSGQIHLVCRRFLLQQSRSVAVSKSLNEGLVGWLPAPAADQRAQTGCLLSILPCVLSSLHPVCPHKRLHLQEQRWG